jgi:hypothetical protein
MKNLSSRTVSTNIYVICIVQILSTMNYLVESSQITISDSTNAIKMTESIGRTWAVIKVLYEILVE